MKMRVRRVALLALMTVSCLVMTAAVAPAANEAKAPDGFHTVKVKKAGFSIAIPDEWEVINLTRGDVDKIFDQLRETAPDLANQLPANVEQLAAQNVVLMAFDDETVDGFTANVNVLLLPGVTEPPTIDDIAPSIESVAPDAEFGETEVAGEPAVTAEYELAVGAVDAHLVQYALAARRNGLAITFTSRASEDPPEEFATMLDSIKLLKR